MTQPTSNELLLDRLEDAVRADNEALHSWNGHKRDKIIAKQSERAAARAAVIAAMRAAHEPRAVNVDQLMDDLEHAVRRDDRNSDAYTIQEVRDARAALVAALRPAPPPDDDVRNALKEANELCRASFQVCKRVVEQYGDVALGVNFGALEASLDRSLTMQHAVMLKHEMFMPAVTKSEPWTDCESCCGFGCEKCGNSGRAESTKSEGQS